METAAEREQAIGSDHVVDVDFFRPEREGETVHEAWMRIRETCPPLFWTPRNGGHWVATDPADIRTMQTDFARFRNAGSKVPPGERPFPLLPLESDPPFHSGLRLLIAPAFSPRVFARARDTVRAVAVETIEALVPQGRCEFVSAFAKVLPIVVFLEMMELPAEDRHELLPLADAIARAQDIDVSNAARARVGEYLARWIEERRRDPGEDAISRIVNGRPGGRELTMPEVLGMCSVVLVGGLDTVASILGFAACHLANHPRDREHLRRNPAIIPNAVEELLRRYAIVNQTRKLADDVAMRGVVLRAGDHVLLPNMLVGLSPDVTEHPDRVLLDREEPVHAAFGNGPHKCPGAQLARQELAVFLEEWLARIPEFRVVPGTEPRIVAGTVNGMVELHLEWDG
ncbi:MAG: cytochrome P450 [Novosphingobium sp.]|nr:cytochrome P450 [Novosphingobium sp.]